MIIVNNIKRQTFVDYNKFSPPICRERKPSSNTAIESYSVANKFNDQNVILFGKTPNFKNYNFFNLLLKQKKLTPEQLINQTLTKENMIGSGKEAEIFKIPVKGFENYLIRRTYYYKLRTVDDYTLIDNMTPFYNNKNIGSVISTIGPFEVINKVEGEGFDHPLEPIRNNETLRQRISCAFDSFDNFYFIGYIYDLENCKNKTPEQKKELQGYNDFVDRYRNHIKAMANLPQKSYDKIFEDIKMIYNE
ncbi:MAG: hypothetical protein AB7V50_10605, partial [Vampirovibrionia bacterium]